MKRLRSIMLVKLGTVYVATVLLLAGGNRGQAQETRPNQTPTPPPIRSWYQSPSASEPNYLLSTPQGSPKDLQKQGALDRSKHSSDQTADKVKKARTIDAERVELDRLYNDALKARQSNSITESEYKRRAKEYEEGMKRNRAALEKLQRESSKD